MAWSFERVKICLSNGQGGKLHQRRTRGQAQVLYKYILCSGREPSLEDITDMAWSFERVQLCLSNGQAGALHHTAGGETDPPTSTSLVFFSDAHDMKGLPSMTNAYETT